MRRLSKTCRWYGLWKKLLKQLLCYVCEIPVSGVTWIVPRQSPRMLLVALRPFFAWTEDLEFCLCLLKWLHKCPDVTLQLYLHGEMPCLTVVVTLELDLHIAVSSPTLHSAVLLSVVSRLRAGSHAIGWPSWMEWDGREQRPSCYDIFLFFVLASCFSLKKKATQKILLNLVISEVFICVFLSSTSCGKQRMTQFTRSSLKMSPSFEFLIYTSNFLPAF